MVATVALFYFNILPWPFKKGGGKENYGLVVGIVTNTYGLPLLNVNSSISNQTTQTNDQGWFCIPNLAAGNRTVVKFSKSGYATTYQLANVQVGKSSFVEVSMGEVDENDSFNASNGASITTLEGGTVTIPAGSLVDTSNISYMGTAQVSITMFDPTDETEIDAFPGEYIGLTAQNETVPLTSFGFMDISVTDQGGGTLQLAQGENATIRIPVPPTLWQNATELSRCSLWYFDSAKGIWREEGYGIYDPGRVCFTGSVTHFSMYSFDIITRTLETYIEGNVVDSNSTAVQNAQVACWTRGWRTVGPSTGSTGYFKIPVEPGVAVRYQASKGGHKSTIGETGPLNAGEAKNIGNITLDSPLAQIILTWGASPQDLDAHLAAKPANVMEATFHVYYGQKGTLPSEPYADLDTDEREGYGPEVISISRLRPGTYRYSVRHYYGDGNISTSGAVVNAAIENVGLYRFTPPGSQPAEADIWQVFDLVVNSNGKVTAVNQISDYKQGGDDSRFLYP